MYIYHCKLYTVLCSIVVHYKPYSDRIYIICIITKIGETNRGVTKGGQRGSIPRSRIILGAGTDLGSEGP